MATLRINDRRLQRVIKKAEKYVNTRSRFPTQVLKQMKSETPKDQGNARRNTKLKRAPQGWNLTGDYDYSGVIDKGAYPNPPANRTGKTANGYSTQARKGIIKPTVAYAKEIFQQFIRRLR